MKTAVVILNWNGLRHLQHYLPRVVATTHEADIVIADKDAYTKSGDIVIGMDGDEATVKRLLIENGQVIFMPENPDFSPIYPENPSVLGKVIGSFRRY